MVKIDKLVFNSFQVNTYIISDDTGECIIVDPASYGDKENKSLHDYISGRNLIPVGIVQTHCHVDHVLGLSYIRETFDIPAGIHEMELEILENVPLMGEIFGFKIESIAKPDHYIEHNEAIRFGNSNIKALHVPGHSMGSLAYYSQEGEFVISGDALFEGSIGRTDLPGGDYDTLHDSILNRLFSLPQKTIVYPGHGSSTTIEKEVKENPFFNDYKT